MTFLSKRRVKRRVICPACGASRAFKSRGQEWFTGGPVVKKDFSNLADARAWIFGKAQEERGKPGSVLELKSKAGLSAFELSAAEIAEAAAAIKTCKDAGISLSEAVRFAIKHSRPPGGSKRLQEAIDALVRAKAEAGRSPRHLRGLRWSLEKFAAAHGKEKSGRLVATSSEALGRVTPFLQNAWHRSLEAIAESAGLVLPPNVLRHSFGRYHFAQRKNENLTAAEMGNSPAMVFQHYRAVVTPEVAARFWSLVPSPKSNVIDFVA